MTYQFGFINEHARFLKDRPKKYCKTDYFFVFHEIDKKIFEKSFSSNFIVSGSVRNNSFVLEKIKNKKYFITYISEFKKNLKLKIIIFISMKKMFTNIKQKLKYSF